MAKDSASVGADIRAMIGAIAGAAATKKPAEKKRKENPLIVSIRRRRTRRRVGEGDAMPTSQLEVWQNGRNSMDTLTEVGAINA